MSAILERLEASGLEAIIDLGDESRARHARDWWARNELRDFQGTAAAPPLGVVTPRSRDEVAAVLRCARDTATPVIPYGGGSGVCGAIEGRPDAIVLSTAGLDGLVSLDDTDLLATFRAGTNGMAAERRVQRDGLTIGHWPQSIELSTVGGWIATRAAGQFSTGYGNIEDIVHDLEVVLPDGSVMRTRRTPRAAAGPDLRHLFLGSEGTLGIVTEVTFSLRALPEASQGQAISFPSIEAGLDGARRLMRAGYRPPVARLYDDMESARNFENACPEGRHLLLLLHEGPAVLVEPARAGVAKLCAELGGTEHDPGVVDRWLERRNHVPGFRGFMEKGIILDTIEVAAPWSRVAELYHRVVSSLREVEGILVASGHSSHSYRSGTNLYFTFLARPAEATAMAASYDECWRRTMEATLACGGGIAHHHGIGRVRRDFLSAEIGEAGVETLRAVKRALDPDGLLNPGALIP